MRGRVRGVVGVVGGCVGVDVGGCGGIVVTGDVGVAVYICGYCVGVGGVAS